MWIFTYKGLKQLLELGDKLGSDVRIDVDLTSKNTNEPSNTGIYMHWNINRINRNGGLTIENRDSIGDIGGYHSVIMELWR